MVWQIALTNIEWVAQVSSLKPGFFFASGPDRAIPLSNLLFRASDLPVANASGSIFAPTAHKPPKPFADSPTPHGLYPHPTPFACA